jgi:hypothetical protein
MPWEKGGLLGTLHTMGGVSTSDSVVVGVDATSNTVLDERGGGGGRKGAGEGLSTVALARKMRKVDMERSPNTPPARWVKENGGVVGAVGACACLCVCCMNSCGVVRACACVV